MWQVICLSLVYAAWSPCGLGQSSILNMQYYTNIVQRNSRQGVIIFALLTRIDVLFNFDIQLRVTNYDYCVNLTSSFYGSSTKMIPFLKYEIEMYLNLEH